MPGVRRRSAGSGMILGQFLVRDVAVTWRMDDFLQSSKYTLFYSFTPSTRVIWFLVTLKNLLKLDFLAMHVVFVKIGYFCLFRV